MRFDRFSLNFIAMQANRQFWGIKFDCFLRLRHSVSFEDCKYTVICYLPRRKILGVLRNIERGYTTERGVELERVTEKICKYLREGVGNFLRDVLLCIPL